MIGNCRGTAVTTGEDRSIAGDDVDDGVRRGLHSVARHRSSRRTEMVKIGVEVAPHAVIKSFREESQDKPLSQKRGIL